MMTRTLCQMIAGQNSTILPTAAPLGTTQLVRYTFADSWGCHLQADLPATQRIVSAAPNQVLECPTVLGAVYVKQDAPCQFTCDENHTRTSDTCTRVCGNATAAACEPRHFASTVCNHAGYTLYQCEPCAYNAGLQALPWSALYPDACLTDPCAAGTYGAGGVCVPCSQDNFSTAGSAACSPCARGTFAPVGSGVCATCFQDTYALTQPGFGDAGVSITPGVMVVLKWPSSAHPVLLSINTNVAWNNPVTYDAPSFAVNVDATLLQTTFTVPESYTGALYYICQLHSSMGVHAITLLANTPCVAGAAATRSVAAIDAYFARALAAGHNVSQHKQLSAFCHARGACLPCLPGEFEQAGACVACDFAHYQPNFQMPRCFECATGHNTSARGSRLAADCRCQPGFE
jgi:plastocyanin